MMLASALLTDAKPTEILQSAMRLEKTYNYLHPAVMKRKLLAIGAVWIIGLTALVVFATEIAHGAGATEQQRLLYSFCLLLSAVTWVAANVTMLVTLWNGYVYQYVLALEAQSEVAEHADDIVVVAEAALNLASDEEFRTELTEKLSSKAAATLTVTPEKLAEETISHLAAKANSAAAAKACGGKG